MQLILSKREMRTINKEKIVAEIGHVVVLRGGQSVEREISLLSGQAVYEGLQRLGVHSTVFDVGDELVDDLRNAQADCVFNMLHGKFGEDGTLQGLLEALKIPCTGSGVLASALAMDKVRSKLLWQTLGLNTAEFVRLDRTTNWQEVIKKLGAVVVKPVNGGSSLGITIAEDAASLAENYITAANFDSEVMAERCITGKEFSVAIVHGSLLPAIQLRTDRQFFDFDAKYIDEGTQLICPPELSAEKQLELGRLAKAAYFSLGCEGLARVDVMQDQEENFYLLEVNTVPGMTNHSFVPMAAREAGMEFDELLLHILDTDFLENKS